MEIRYNFVESVCALCFSLKWMMWAGFPIDFCRFQIMKSSLWSMAKNSHRRVANFTFASSSALEEALPPLAFLSGDAALAEAAGPSSWKYR